MQEPEFQSFTKVALFMAEMGDGSMSDSELRVLLGSVAKLGADSGMEPAAAMKIAALTAAAYVAERPKPSIRERAASFETWMQMLQDNVTPELLPRLYRELVQIAASDGQMAAGERTILAEIRSRWILAA